MSTGIPYLGSKISLISKSEIRYEGILYTIDTQMSTVALAKVRSFGTEDRPTDRPVAPRDEVYEYIIFRGADIKDIRVCEPPKPQATLQGGLPNDPAIVKHSTSAAPGGPIGSKAHGPIGSGYGAIGSGPSHNSPIELENVRSTGSTPAGDLRRSPTNDAGVQTKDRQQNRSRQDSQSSGRPHSAGRGGPSPGQPIGFHRGGRGGPRGGGGGGVVHQQNQHNQHPAHQGQGGNQSFRGRGGQGRGGFQPGRPQPGKKETLKFEADYDFEQANEQFQEVLSQLSKTKIDDPTADVTAAENGENGEEIVDTVDVNVEPEEGEINEEDEEEVYYDKQKSFFDSISCEALERSKGKLVRNDWRAEKRLNKETFGVAGNRRYGYGGRGGYYNNRGGRGFNNQGGQGYNRGGGYGRGGGQGMAQRGFGNGGGYNNGGGFGGGYNRGRGGYGGQNGGQNGGGYGQGGGGGYGGQRGFGNGGGYDRDQREGGRGGMGGGDRMGQRGGGYAAAVRGGGPNQGMGLRRPSWGGDRNH